MLDFGWNNNKFLCWSTSPTDTFYQVSRFGFSVQEKNVKIDFQNGGLGNHLRFLTRMVLAILIYRSPQYFLPSFESIDPSVKEKKSLKYIFEMATVAAILDL